MHEGDQIRSQSFALQPSFMTIYLPEVYATLCFSQQSNSLAFQTYKLKKINYFGPTKKKLRNLTILKFFIMIIVSLQSMAPYIYIY